MVFKDQVTADLDVFLNVEEFAAELTLDDGYTVACILDETAASLPGNRGQSSWEGVSQVDFTVSCRASSYSTPAVDQRISIDGRPAVVVSAAIADGLLVVKGRWYES